MFENVFDTARSRLLIDELAQLQIGEHTVELVIRD
jgi:hypothetical protein